jgi:hypothetical protein
MRLLILLSVTTLFFACKKVETTPQTPTTPVIQEESIKFTTNIDSSTPNIIDTLALTINVISRIPSNGIIYSVNVYLNDSSKSTYKVDTLLNKGSLTLSIPNFNQLGKFDIRVELTSKSNNSNSSKNTYTYAQNLKIVTSEIFLNHPKQADIWKGLPVSSLGTIDFIDPIGKEMMVITPSNQKTPEPWIKVPTFTLVKENNIWVIKNYYDDINFGMGGRDVQKFGNDGYVWIDTGPELNTNGVFTFPMNHIYLGTIIGNGIINWKQVSTDRSFYHGGYTGDLNHDGLLDVAAVHMKTTSKIDERIHTFINKGGNNFTQEEIIVPKALFKQASWSAGTLIIDDVNGDNLPEIIKADYVHFSTDIVRHSIEVYTDPDKDGKYTELYFHPVMSKWGGDIGAARLKLYDYDKDGDKDLFVKFEQNTAGLANYGGIRILNNNGKGIFSESTATSIDITLDKFIPAEFDLFDVDNDGDLDIVFNAFKNFDNPDELIYNYGGDKNVKYNGNPATVNFGRLIYFNEGNGKFINKKIGLERYLENGAGIVWIKGFKVGKDFKFVCMQVLSRDYNDPSTYRTRLIEVFPKF